MVSQSKISIPEFTTSKIFKPNYDFYKAPVAEVKTIANQGGTSSSKTYTLLQLLFIIAAEDPECLITIAGQDIPNLKKGAIRDSRNIISHTDGLDSLIDSYNKTDRIYEFVNGSMIEFTSYADEQDAKSGKRDYLFLNEANGIDYQIAWQLMIRTRKKVFIDYNPTAKFWVHEKILQRPNSRLIISDHRHNPFLSREQHDEIEGIDDPELHKVYARGLTGKIHGLIYPRYQLIDAIPGSLKPVYGLDFGFNHKMALVETAKLDNRIFWNEMIYQSELTIGDLIQQMRELGIGRSKIYCDSARPDAIEDLKRAGFNALPAQKDVFNGINYIKSNTLYITRSSKGLIKEIQHYKWKQHKQTDEFIDEPAKFMDDGMDAGRYGSYTSRRSGKISVGAPSNVSEDRSMLDDIEVD